MGIKPCLGLHYKNTTYRHKEPPDLEQFYEDHTNNCPRNRTHDTLRNIRWLGMYSFGH